MLGRGRLTAVGAAALSLLAAACGSAYEPVSPLQSDDATPGGSSDAGSNPSDANGPPPPAACVGATPVTVSSILLDGVDDFVGMGPAKALGLDHFTVEAWVR